MQEELNFLVVVAAGLLAQEEVELVSLLLVE